jgi:hippurate hydrolase
MNIAAKAAAPASGARTAIAANVGDFVVLRHELHRKPELAFAEHETTARLAGLLSDWGYRVEKITRTGLIATLENGPGPRLGLRADIDALPIREATGLPYASGTEGVMHACGHDGHTAILMAAAQYLARTRAFRGTLRLIFQPAEEIGAGAQKLIKAGLFARFPVDAIFGLHNWPGVPAGRFGFIEGAAMAAIDRVEARILGRGGHGAEPHLSVDPVVAAAHAVSALQTVVSRSVDPREMAVVTVGSIHGGAAANVIPGAVDLQLTLRSYSAEVRAQLKKRVAHVLRTTSDAFGAEAHVDVTDGFPSVINTPGETALLRSVAEQTFGPGAILPEFAPRTASEDFAFYLHHRPGSFFFVGNGEGAPLHSPEYRFNDDIIAPAATLWVALAERYLNGASHD